MRSEIKKIAAIIANVDCVYLRGPIGSGKTFLARNFQVELLTRLKEQNQPEKIFVLYQAGSSESIEALYTIDGKDQSWQSCAEALLTLRLLQHKKKLPYSYQEVRFWREILRPLLQEKKYQFIIILDDYDEYRQRITTDLKLFNEMKEQNVRFILTGTKPVIDFHEKVEEIDFLSDFINIDISLPTLEGAEKIAQSCWKNKVGNNAPDLQRKHLSEIVQIAGNYPLLIDNLVSCFVDMMKRSNTSYDLTDASRNLTRRMDENLGRAVQERTFFESMQQLWDSLTNIERETLTVLAIDQKAREYALEKDLFETWLNRNKDEKREEAKEIQIRLGKERLLLKEAQKSRKESPLPFKQNRPYEIASRALFEFIYDQPKTKELAKSLDFKLPKRKQFRSMILVALTVFSAILHLIYNLLFQDKIQAHDVLLSKIIGFLSWVFPIIYFVINFRRVDSDHRNPGLN